MADADTPAGADELFRLFVDTVQEYAIFLVTPDGRLASWNAGVGYVLGYTADEFVGRPFDIIFTPEDLAAGIAAMELRTAADTGRADDERWHVRKDGSQFWALGVTFRLLGPAGELKGFAKVAQDRTHQKQLQEYLRHKAEVLSAVDGRKDVFLATLAHELRNPLSGIVNATAILRHLGGATPALAGPVAVIGRQTAVIRRLVDDLMDAARVASGKLELRPERVELAAVVRSAVETVRPAVDARRHRLVVELPTPPVWLDADPARLEQVFGNLLGNAAKYTPDGGDISLVAVPEGDEVVVRVRDSGIGIPGDVLPRIFELFAQDTDALPRAAGGLGIGLSVVKALVGQHGGTVQVRSEGKGKGSEFVVRLPAARGG